MFNGDDVLDNWEEIDEQGINSSVEKFKNSTTTCERITNISYHNNDTIIPSIKTVDTTSEASNLKPTQMKLLQRSTTQDSTTTTSLPKPSPLDDMAATFHPVMMVLHKPQDEYHSANYTPPIANQTVKILRRPTQTIEPRNNGIRPKLPLKTLQQREQEYAEARLRILGSAKNPEDDEQKTATITVTTTMIQTPIITSTQSTPNAAPVNNSFTNLVSSNTRTISPKIQGGANQYGNHFNQQLQNHQQQQQQQQQYQQNYQSQQQQQPQNYFYNQQKQQPQSPAYNNNNNRTYNLNPLLGLGPMGAIGQPAQYPATTTSSQTQQKQPPQQHLKYQQFLQKSSQLHQKSQQQQQTWSPVVGGSVSSSSLRQPQNDTILRLPRGPDGTTGFQMRR